jgi:dipeptidyl aminopeptidase/acylaminoacyl peptidase
MNKPARKKRTRRAISAEDLFKLRLPTGVAMSPDEKRIAYTVERMDKQANKYFSNIFLHDLKIGKSDQFTHGDHNDGQPVWSPDGSQIAFVSSRDKKTGIYVMPTTGGAEKKLIEIEGAIASLQWMPDGAQLLFNLRYSDSHFIKDEKKKKEQPVYRHITELYYRLDGDGFRPRDRFHIYTLDIETAKLKKVTRGNRDNLTPRVTPDGKRIVFLSNRAKDPDIDLERLDLFVIPATGGKERRIPTPAGPMYAPSISPDGKYVAYLGHDNPNDPWGVYNHHIWKVGLSGKAKAVDLMPTFDRNAYDQCISDTGDVGGGEAVEWSSDGKRVFFLSSDTGVTNLFSIPAKGGRPTRLFKSKGHIKGFSINGKTGTAALIRADLTNPGELVTCPTTYGGEKKAKQCTNLNSFLHTERTLGRTREISIKSFDGTIVQGWLVTPPKFKPTRKYSAILEIHGGPRVQYGFTFFHEMQYLAAKGYVVLYTNPRGGAGRGETWADAISGGWGDLDFKDCMAAADWLEKQKFVNPKKLGVTGGSYGGYMTNWIIGHTNRFAAAVTQRSVVNLISFFGASDFGWSLDKEFDGYPWTNKENYEKCSPITYFNKVRTPVLIIHSENDLRCGIEQAEQMFATLKVLKRKVEMVRFPEEPHGLSRHGRPDRRIARLEWIDKWFKKYLNR